MYIYIYIIILYIYSEREGELLDITARSCRNTIMGKPALDN